MANIVVQLVQLITPTHLALALVLILMVIVFDKFVRYSHHTKLNKVPGPFPLWPLLGNIPLLDKVPHQDFYKLSQKYGDIMQLKLGSTCVIIISSFERAKEVFQKHDQEFSFRRAFMVTEFLSYGRRSLAWTYEIDDHWQRLRKMEVSELFSPKSLNASTYVRDEEISSLVHHVFEDCKEGKPTNMRTRLVDTSMNMMTRVLYGKRYFGLEFSNKKAKEFQDMMTEQLNLARIFNIGDYIPFLKPFDLQGISAQLKPMRLRMDQFYDEMIQDRLTQDGLNDPKDFLGAMLSRAKTYGLGDRLGNNTIKAIFYESMHAGTETTSSTTEWAMAELLKNPKFARKAQNELDDVIGLERVVNESDIPQLKYLQAIVKETFRLHPAVPLLLPSENQEGCEIGGYHIPPKTVMFMNVWAIHRDPFVYENPTEFNPERFVGSNVDLKGKDFQLLPFGSGRRMCPGLPLGLTSVQLELAKLLQSFTWKLPKGENAQDIDMAELYGISNVKKIPLHVIATPRLPLHLYAAPQFTNCGD